jgi:Carbohydrate binding module (family 35)/Glycosyl hydrolase catalytic core
VREGPIRHVAAGSLYGIADEHRPGEHNLHALRPMNVTQMAPGGGQLPNGETEPTGDALIVAGIAARHGATVTIRLPDIYPHFPYRWEGWDDWLSRVIDIVNAVTSAKPDNVYAYEVWNEPNWTWAAEAGPFAHGWCRTVEVIRQYDTETAVMGPSIDRWDADWMGEFLKSVMAQGLIPDIVAWHELDPSDTDLERHVSEYRSLESELGISPLPISINEYGSHRDMAVPGALVSWMARLERSSVDTANLAFWHKPGRFSDLVTANNSPTGGWWPFHWYARLDGDRLGVNWTGNDGVGVLAAIDDSEVTLIVGGAGGDLQFDIDEDLNRSLGDGAKWLTIEGAEWTGTDGESSGPQLFVSAELATSLDGRLRFTLPDADPLSAYRIVVRRGTVASREAPIRWTFSQLGAQAHLALSDQSTVGAAVRLTSGEQVEVSFPRSIGIQEMSIRYRNNSVEVAALSFVSVDGIVDKITLPPTFGKFDAFPIGHSARTRMSAERTTVLVADGDVELDSVRIAPFRRRIEAEDAEIVRGSVQCVDMSPSAFRSNRFSGDGFANWLNEVDSSVTFTTEVPATGAYRLVVGYGLGSGPASHLLEIDGVSIGEVTYAETQGDELVGSVSVDVPLYAGSHRIRLRKAQCPGSVTLDYLDVIAVG